MNKLYEFLDKASQYYFEGRPIISDEQFDRLSASSGYYKVGAKTSDTEAHYWPLYSLQKWYSDEAKEKPLAGELEICVTPKLDGAAVSLLYIDGHFVRALTRGDGKEGKVVTEKLSRLVPNYCEKLKAYKVVQIVGEVCAPASIENSRNYAAGSLNLGDLNEWKTRSVEFFAYSIYPYPTDTFTKDIQLLQTLGFNTVFDRNIENIYPSDGLVFRVNSNARFEELGYTSKHPRGAYAKKERQPWFETILRSVEWNVGKTGKVTPTAIFDPVTIDGKVVSRATLNNPGFIEALDLRIGDTIGVRLAGMIIPEVSHKVEA